MSNGTRLILAMAAFLAMAAAPEAAEAQARGNPQARGGGPPFCQNGNGHPVHGWRWCVEKGYARGNYGRYDDRRYDDRGFPRDDDRGSNSYQRDHDEFHRYLDRKYGDLAARRPLDVQYQLQLRQERQREHDEWHRRVGIRH